MILVDTSIWVAHLRQGDPVLETLLLEADVVCHPFIIGELACGDLKNRREILSLLGALPAAPVIDPGEILFFIEQNRLMGLCIGLVDVHLLASARLAGVWLWTRDKKLKAAAEQLQLALTGR